MKRMTVVLVLLAAIAIAAPAFAVPLLQLDMEGGWYDPVTQTIVTSEDAFVLRALLTPNGTIVDEQGNIEDASPHIDWLSLPYYLSIALVPKAVEEDPAPDLGTIVFDGDTISVADGMTFGNPPLDTYLEENKNLPPHGIFNTYYYETVPGFFFTSTNVTPTYNTQDRAVNGYITEENGYSYILTWMIDVSGLDYPYQVHFDLYNLYSDVVMDNSNIKEIHVFAPFSHDAETVPEPGSLLLIGIGMVGLAGMRKRLSA